LLDEMILLKHLENGTCVALDTEQLIPPVRVFLASRSLFEGFHPGESGRLPDVAEALVGCGVPSRGTGAAGSGSPLARPVSPAPR